MCPRMAPYMDSCLCLEYEDSNKRTMVFVEHSVQHNY